MRRNTVSVTPAMGARTVAGRISIFPILKASGSTSFILQFSPVTSLALRRSCDGEIDVSDANRYFTLFIHLRMGPETDSRWYWARRPRTCGCDL